MMMLLIVLLVPQTTSKRLAHKVIETVLKNKETDFNFKERNQSEVIQASLKEITTIQYIVSPQMILKLFRKGSKSSIRRKFNWHQFNTEAIVTLEVTV